MENLTLEDIWAMSKEGLDLILGKLADKYHKLQRKRIAASIIAYNTNKIKDPIERSYIKNVNFAKIMSQADTLHDGLDYLKEHPTEAIVDNFKLEEHFKKLAQLYSDLNEVYKNKAFKVVADIIASYSKPITEADQLSKVKFIGPSTLKEIKDYFIYGDNTPRMLELLEKTKGWSESIQAFKEVYGIGQEKAIMLYKQGYRTVPDLLVAMMNGTIHLTKEQELGLKYYYDLKKTIPRFIIDEYIKVLSKYLGKRLKPDAESKEDVYTIPLNKIVLDPEMIKILKENNVVISKNQPTTTFNPGPIRKSKLLNPELSYENNVYNIIKGRHEIISNFINGKDVTAVILSPGLKTETKTSFVWTVAGSYRRGMPVSRDIDILIRANATDYDLPKIVKMLQDEGIIVGLFANGDKKVIAVTKIPSDKTYRHIDIRIFDSESWAYALLYNTGPRDFNIRMRERATDLGYSLNEYRLTYENDKTKLFPSETEADIFGYLDMKYIPPTERT